jgi:hypothetical protein
VVSREQRAESMRRYRAQYPERVVDSQRRYREKYSEKWRKLCRDYRAARTPEEKERIRTQRREKYAGDKAFRTHTLDRQRKSYLRRKARRMETPAWFLKINRREMQERQRLHLRALHLPCGQREECSGCPKIGGRRVEFSETGFKFGRGA